jgi:hypothetical protein
LRIYNRTAKIKNTVHKRQNNGKMCLDYSKLSHKIFGKVKGDGAGDEIRTHDILVGNEMLYH